MDTRSTAVYVKHVSRNTPNSTSLEVLLRRIAHMGTSAWPVVFCNGVPRSCRVDGGCISSTNFPSSYPNDDECNLQAPPLDPQHPLAMEVVSFSTEQGYDFLTVNGVLYSGNVGPQSIVPEGTISWRADARRESRLAVMRHAKALTCLFQGQQCHKHGLEHLLDRGRPTRLARIDQVVRNARAAARGSETDGGV